jgi:hypothetical protein
MLGTHELDPCTPENRDTLSNVPNAHHSLTSARDPS